MGAISDALGRSEHHLNYPHGIWMSEYHRYVRRIGPEPDGERSLRLRLLDGAIRVTSVGPPPCFEFYRKVYRLVAEAAGARWHPVGTKCVGPP